MSRLRRFSLPTLVFAAAVFICGKLLLTPVKTFEVARHGYGSWGSIGALESGWPWVYWKRIDGIVFPPNSPSTLDVSYSDGMLSADLAVLSLVAIAAWLVSFWLWRRTQYRLRYSLRGLLLATFVIAIPMSWIARQLYDWRREQFWIGELDNVNIQIDTNDYADLYQNRLGTSLSSVTVEPCDFPEWLRRLSPDRLRPLFRRVKCIEVKSWVTLRKRAFESVLEAALHEMQLVRSLHVGRDCGFQLLDASAFANIESLAIDDPIDDRMLQVIAALPRLRSLKLIGSNVSDGGFDCLADCRHLEKLSIWSVSPVGIEHIAKCATLERLRISDSNLFDADFVPMAKLRQLRYLSLSSSRITDAVIDTVAMLPALEELMVDYPSITDVGAERLCDLRKLKCRSLNDRLISDATARQLKERIPIVEVLSR